MNFGCRLDAVTCRGTWLDALAMAAISSCAVTAICIDLAALGTSYLAKGAYNSVGVRSTVNALRCVRGDLQCPSMQPVRTQNQCRAPCLQHHDDSISISDAFPQELLVLSRIKCIAIYQSRGRRNPRPCMQNYVHRGCPQPYYSTEHSRCLLATSRTNAICPFPYESRETETPGHE